MQQACSGLQLQRVRSGVAIDKSDKSAIGRNRLVACAQFFVQIAQIEQRRSVVGPAAQRQVEFAQRRRLLMEMVAIKSGAIEVDLLGDVAPQINACA